MSEEKEYLLGINHGELERLVFQQGVWGGVTSAFLDRIGIRKGWNCLDVGAGPGLVATEILDRVGDDGHVTLMEPGAYYLEYFNENASNKGISNYTVLNATVDKADLKPNAYDFIFVRWVIDFVPDPNGFLQKLFSALKPGGVIALQDYYYEGLSLFPKGGALDELPAIMKAYYAFGGGDPYFTGKIPAIFSENGLKLIDYTPNLIAGPPGSGAFEWANRFFPLHIPIMAEKGIISKEKSEALIADWNAHYTNPDGLFFSPIVMDVAGRKM